MQIDWNVLPIIYSLFALLCKEHINMWLLWSQYRSTILICRS